MPECIRLDEDWGTEIIKGIANRTNLFSYVCRASCGVCVRDHCPLHYLWPSTQIEFQFTSIVNDFVPFVRELSFPTLLRSAYTASVGIHIPMWSTSSRLWLSCRTHNRLHVSHNNFRLHLFRSGLFSLVRLPYPNLQGNFRSTHAVCVECGELQAMWHRTMEKN